MLFNTHSHINDKNIENIDEILKKAKDNKVSSICVIGTNLEDSNQAINLAQQYDNLYASVGIHPSELSTFDDKFDDLMSLYKKNKVVAIGEIGLDYYYQEDIKEKQLFYFEEFLKQACNIQKPVIIHCRDAYLDTYNLLEKYHKQLDGIIMHCYTGSIEMMERFLKLGCYISISGVVTFKNAKNVQEMVKKIPLDRLLIETDDPYMTPVPFRGQKNEPGYVYYVAQKIAELRNLSFETVAKITTENAKKVFHV